MRNVVYSVLAVLLLATAGWGTVRYNRNRLDANAAKFLSDADNLLAGLQQFKEFTGSYPSGSNLDIARALSGQTDKKVLILAVRKSDHNQKGEIVDPWGTPIQIFISGNGVLIRSAGPNKAFEDSSVAGSDDLFRSN
jgi:hypothetical protein